jgi:hypothetical protein
MFMKTYEVHSGNKIINEAINLLEVVAVAENDGTQVNKTFTGQVFLSNGASVFLRKTSFVDFIKDVNDAIAQAFILQAAGGSVKKVAPVTVKSLDLD